MNQSYKPSSLAQLLPDAIRLEIQGLIPNLKNTKRVVGNRVMADKDTRARTREIIRALESQLVSVLQTGDAATPMDQRLSCLMQSLPHDDCWAVIRELIVTSDPSNEDGATIWIERLP